MTMRSRIIGIDYPELYRAGSGVTLNGLAEVGTDRIRLIKADDEGGIRIVGEIGPFDVSSKIY